MNATKPEKFDVVVYEIKTRTVTNIVGRNLGETGFHTVDKRLETMASRLNDRFDAEAVPAGTVKVGDTIP